LHQLRGLTAHLGDISLFKESLVESRLDVREALVVGALQLELAGANGEREGIHRAAMKGMCS